MRVESVGGAALGFTKPKTIRSVLIARHSDDRDGCHSPLIRADRARPGHRRTAADDTLVGTRHDDRIRGRAGDDEASARLGRDNVLGGPGHDVVSLGPGNDFARVGGHDGGIGCFCGADTIFGGRGDDLIIQGTDLTGCSGRRFGWRAFRAIASVVALRAAATAAASEVSTGVTFMPHRGSELRTSSAVPT